MRAATLVLAVEALMLLLTNLGFLALMVLQVVQFGLSFDLVVLTILPTFLTAATVMAFIATLWNHKRPGVMPGVLGLAAGFVASMVACWCVPGILLGIMAATLEFSAAQHAREE